MRLLALACIIAACGGSSSGPSSPKQPHVLGQAEMLAHVPGGNALLVGGDYARVQSFLQGKVGRAIEGLAGKFGMQEQMTRWFECYGRFQNSIRAVGGVTFRGGKLVWRSVMTGLTVNDLAGCAREAGFAVRMDADGKYVAIEINAMGKTTGMAYLALPDGSLYSRQWIPLLVTPTAADRSELEQDIASASKWNANSDADQLALARQVDKTQSLWFAGSAKGTPLASSLGDFYGTLDLEHGFRMTITAQFPDPSLVPKVVQTFQELRTEAERIGPELVSLVDDITVRGDGDRVHIAVQWTDAQLGAAIERAASRVPKTRDLSLELARLNGFTDAMCACSNASCAQKVADALTQWGNEQKASSHSTDRVSESDAKRIAEMTKRMSDCMTRAMAAGAGSAAP